MTDRLRKLGLLVSYLRETLVLLRLNVRPDPLVATASLDTNETDLDTFARRAMLYQVDLFDLAGYPPRGAVPTYAELRARLLIIRTMLHPDFQDNIISGMKGTIRLAPWTIR